MIRSSFMRIVLVVGSVLILVGVGLMTWMIVTEDERNNIVVDLFDDDPDSLKFESLSLGFMRDELTKFSTYLDKVFGKNTMVICKAYIEQLKKNM